MKLLTKTTLYFVTISLFIFFILGIGVYQMVKRLEDRKVNQELNDQRIRFVHDLEHSGKDLSNSILISGGLLQILPVQEIQKPEIQFSDTLILDPIHNNLLPYRRLSYYTIINGEIYKMSVFKSLYESDYLVEQVALIFLVTIICFLLTVYFLYQYYFGHIWADFFNTINKIEQFNLSSPQKVEFSPSTIIEFSKLNEVIKKMVDRINADFQGIKEFTGNLTHEIQTPLAVIRSKTDLLIQDNCTEKQMIAVGEINTETVRLSNLIKALNLLTRLEHNLYTEKQSIDIVQLLELKLSHFNDFIETRHLNIETKINEQPKIEMSPELADILFGNLIKNAIRHNVDNGFIKIELDKQHFIITNSGQHIDFDPEVLFDRFMKGSKTTESLGIGLSLVKKISEYYAVKIFYRHENGKHEIVLTF